MAGKMEADSTTKKDNQFYHNPNSAETLSSEGDEVNICFICKVKDTEVGVRENRILAEENNKSIFFAESKIFLLCQQCYKFCHLHCHVNGNITVEHLITIIEEEFFICSTCSGDNGQD